MACKLSVVSLFRLEVAVDNAETVQVIKGECQFRQVELDVFLGKHYLSHATPSTLPLSISIKQPPPSSVHTSIICHCSIPESETTHQPAL